MADVNPSVTQAPPTTPTAPAGGVPQSTGVTAADLQKHKQELGLLGKFFGSSAEKAGNIAGFAVIVSFLAAIAVMLWMPDGASITKKDAALSFVSIITLALGFLFGRGSAS